MEMTENEKKKDYLWGYRRAVRKQKRIEDEIVQRIEDVGDETEILLLKYRYIIGLKWEDIAVKMDISSLRRIFRIHGRALENLIVD